MLGTKSSVYGNALLGVRHQEEEENVNNSANLDFDCKYAAHAAQADATALDRHVRACTLLKAK